MKAGEVGALSRYLHLEVALLNLGVELSTYTLASHLSPWNSEAKRTLGDFVALSNRVKYTMAKSCFVPLGVRLGGVFLMVPIQVCLVPPW